MSELLKNITVRVVGVSYQNDDGTDRQEILSGLSVGEAMLLDYFEYENEPAYAVTDALGNQIGNLPKDLSADIYRNYRDCYFSVQIDDITGGINDLKYGCIISIDIYDTIPDAIKQDSPDIATVENITPATSSTLSKRSRRTYGIIFIILGVILALFGLLLSLAVPVGGILAIIGGVICIIIGRKYRKS